MNAIPLKVTAALTIIDAEQLTLSQVLNIIEDPHGSQQLLICTVSSDPQFWLLVARKYCGEEMVSRRMDIAFDQWERFVKEFAVGTMGLYNLVGDWGLALKVADGPTMQHYGIRTEHYALAQDYLDGLPDPIGDYTHLRFEIDGIQPEKFCLGYTTRFYFDDPIQVPMNDCCTFVCKEKTQIAAMFDQLVTYLATEFLNMCHLHLIPQFAPGMDGFSIRATQFDVMPTLEDLKALFVDMLDADAQNANIKMSHFRDNGDLRFREYTMGAVDKDDDEIVHLTMLIDVSQLRFKPHGYKS